MIAFDLDTLGLSERNIILAMSIVQLDENETFTFSEIEEKMMFIKFSVDEQKSALKRTVNKSAVDFWSKNDVELQRKVFFPSKTDHNVREGLKMLVGKINFDDLVFTKGIHDAMMLKSLYEDVGLSFPFKYNNFRDIRTGIDFLKITGSGGICKYPSVEKVLQNYSKDMLSLDLHMLLNGE